MAIIFAVCCLLFAAANDFVFSLFAREKRSNGVYFSLIGVIWMLAFIAVPQESSSVPAATWLWGAVSGLLSVSSNLLLVEAMSRESAGVCSTIFRLNMVLVVLGATLFLGETLTLWQWGGVLLAVLAVLSFIPRGGSGREIDRVKLTGFLLVICAAVLRAGMGLSYKYGFLHGADRNGVVLINSLFWIAGGIFYALFWEKKSLAPEKRTVLFSLLSGGLIIGIVFFMAAALQIGNASVVLPIAQMSFLGTTILSVLVWKERWSALKISALLCGVSAIVLLINGR